MHRKNRLSFRRKNEFRKRRKERRGLCSVNITKVLPISIPKAEICLFKLSIPKEYYNNIHLKTIDSLKEKVEASFTFPQGKKLFLYSPTIYFAGWVTTPQSNNCFSIVKIDSIEPDAMKQLIVRSDMTWYTYINSQKINSDASYYSNLPHTASSLTSLNQIVASLDSCTLCAGNDDNNFHILITAKKHMHGFTDASGKYKMIAYTI